MIGPSTYGIGDTNHATFAIWRELAKGFHHLKVLARARGKGGAWKKEGVDVELIRSMWKREFEFLFTQFALLKRARAYRPDVVVSQGVALGGWAAIAIARLCKAGTLIEVHSDDFLNRASLLSKKGLLQLLSGPVFARARLIRVLSERMGESLIAIYGEHLRDKLRVLPPRVDTERFKPPAKRKSPDGRLDLVMVGALHERKGQLRLIRALEAAGLPITLHIFGDGPDRYAVDAAAAQTNEGPFKIEVYGNVTHDELARALGRFDALVMYSVSEGTPRAMMEAMATGLPVITTDAGFCADIVKHRQEGIVLSATDTDADLINHLEWLLHNPSVLRAMGDAAMYRARQQFAADKLFPLYRRLIAEAAGL